jgi:uncharacterized protein YuzE
MVYVKPKHAKIVDNDPLDEEELVLASLDGHGKVVGLVIVEASTFSEQCKNRNGTMVRVRIKKKSRFVDFLDFCCGLQFTGGRFRIFEHSRGAVLAFLD